TEGEPLMLRGSRELIGQALANLVDNAVKYGGPGGEIRVTAARSGESLRLSVSDSGPGIPSEARGRVLDRFVRLEEARSRPGFGLGLSLVNAVVRLHQGTLGLEDRASDGNAPGLVVVLTLPMGAPGE
ncbi:sensor histidine kinase, partial [Methylobacterium sp.]|uniref:sensor histidine kinase n=1 Tax=Methylobacterium sp. TaxID=409 RepID=UPI0026224DA5